MNNYKIINFINDKSWGIEIQLKIWKNKKWSIKNQINEMNKQRKEKEVQRKGFTEIHNEVIKEMDEIKHKISIAIYCSHCLSSFQSLSYVKKRSLIDCKSINYMRSVILQKLRA